MIFPKTVRLLTADGRDWELDNRSMRLIYHEFDPSLGSVNIHSSRHVKVSQNAWVTQRPVASVSGSCKSAGSMSSTEIMHEIPKPAIVTWHSTRSRSAHLGWFPMCCGEQTRRSHSSVSLWEALSKSGLYCACVQSSDILLSLEPKWKTRAPP